MQESIERMFKGIHFAVICDVTIESTCNFEHKVFRGPEFISDNYNLVGTYLHDLPDAPPGIPPVHQILQDPVSIGTGT